MTDADTTEGRPEGTARGRILEAAAELFARDGFDRTPVSRIAKLAQVPHGLVFYYFQTKIGLLLALLGDYTSVRVPDLRDEPGTQLDSPYALVGHVLDSIRRQASERSTFRRILFQEMAAHPEVRQQAKEMYGGATAAIADRLREGMSAIGLPVDPETAGAAARMLIATTVMAALIYESDDPQVPPEDLTAAVAGALLHAGAH